MKNDRPKYTPDVAKILRENEPAAFEARQRKALAKVYAAGLIDRLTPEPTPERAARVSAPSPWAKEGASAGAEVDAAALPSAMMPEASLAPAEERPVTKAAERAARKWPATWKLIAGCVLVGAAMPVLVVLAGRLRETTGQAAGMGSATPAVVPSATPAVVPSATPAVVPSVAATEGAVPNGVAIPTATPSETATPSATAPPSVAPPSRPHGVQRTSVDPHGAAAPIVTATAAPIVTAAPITTAAPVVSAPPLATAAPTASASTPFILRKRDN